MAEDIDKTEEKEELNKEEIVNESENIEKEEKKSDSESNSSLKEIDELNNKYLRLYSDFENFRKRTAKEKIDLIESAGGDVIKELLSVIDDFERALNSDNNESNGGLREGVQLIYNKTLSILKNRGLEPMESKGTDFDYELHEAITKILAPSKKEKGKVIDVVEKGYYYKGKVLRYAKVVVGE